MLRETKLCNGHEIIFIQECWKIINLIHVMNMLTLYII